MRISPEEEADRRTADAPGFRSRRRTHRVLLALIGVLYLISVPWYRDTDAPLKLVFGMPDWVAVALGCYVAVAVLNACAWLFVDFPDDPALAEFDLSDRKFAALARRSGAPVANATDGGWLQHRSALEANEISVEFVCGCDPLQWTTGR